MPDAYRGETVKAYVSLRPGEASPKELIEFCKNRMAAYKDPRVEELVDDLSEDGNGQDPSEGAPSRFGPLRSRPRPGAISPLPLTPTSPSRGVIPRG